MCTSNVLHTIISLGSWSAQSNNAQVRMIDPAALPDSSDAAHQFESYGGQLTLFSGFRDDPLKDNAPKIAQR